MSEPALPLWNRDNSDVLPQFQLTFGHVLFRGLTGNDWQPKLFKSLGLGKPSYTGPLQQAAIPLHPREQCPVLGSTTETHLVFARLGDVWSIFGPHDVFFTSKHWMEFNAKAGGLMAFATQMDEDSFSYLVFNGGIKQTNVFVEGTFIRVVPDTPIAAYIGNQRIFEDKSTCSLSDADLRKLIEHDLAIRVTSDQLSIGHRFPDTTAPLEDVMHFAFQRSSPKKSFLGIRLQ